METLQFKMNGTRPTGAFEPVLVGVVGSGNLEALFEHHPTSGECVFDVTTSARGFGQVWQAVFEDFHRRHDLCGLSITIHDMGATPAVVALRLDQAVAELKSTRTQP
jgi:malonate decarboxylase delta subunit